MMNPPAAVTLRRRTDCLDHERLSKNMRRNFNFPLPRWLAIAVLALVALAQVWRHYEAPSIPGPTVPREAPPPSTRAPSIPAPSTPSTPARPYPSFLPAEAPAVIERILRGGPHPHRQDGGVFQNREGRLPSQPRGHYREYTVPTPGSRDRGARRIVTGGDPPTGFWYTGDHYRTFRSFEVPR